MWETIPGTHGFYEASDDGQIRNKRTQRLLTPYQGKVYLSGMQNRTYTIGELVANTFMPGSGRVFHKDGNNMNNNINNLVRK